MRAFDVEEADRQIERVVIGFGRPGGDAKIVTERAGEFEIIIRPEMTGIGIDVADPAEARIHRTQHEIVGAIEIPLQGRVIAKIERGDPSAKRDSNASVVIKAALHRRARCRLTDAAQHVIGRELTVCGKAIGECGRCGEQRQTCSDR